MVAICDLFKPIKILFDHHQRSISKRGGFRGPLFTDGSIGYPGRIDDPDQFTQIQEET